MKPLSDESRKRLTLFLGECWHDYTLGQGFNLSKCSCGLTGMCVRDICAKCNRDFTTYSDLGALKDKLVENGEWDAFSLFAFDKWDHKNPSVKMVREYFTLWLFRPESCALVDEYLKSKEGK